MTEIKKKYSTYFLAFIIPIVVLVIIYIAREIYPFGDNCFLRSDMYHQYAPFLKEFYNKFIQGESLTYSWNIGMGINFVALYAYYLASPLNWLVGLISPKYLIEMMSIFIIFKTGLASLTFCHYLSKRFNSRHIIIAAFSVFYALSSYLAAFNWNLMWLDCIVLLPLIILGIERIVKENKCTLYCVSLAVCIISNYYIAIMICIFSVLYFIITVYSADIERTSKYYTKRFFSFISYSLIAGGLSAFLLIPVYFALQLTASGDVTFPTTLTRYFSIFEMLSRGLMNVEPAIFSAHEPNIYSSVIVFLMFPLYLFNKNINHREKAGKVLLIIIFLISFNLNIPNYIWHGLHFPNSLPCRESFIFIFLLLSLSFEAFKDIRKYTSKQIYGSFAGVVVLFLLFDHFIVNEEYSFTIVYISLIFLTLYLLIIRCFRTMAYQNNFIIYLLFIVVICEAAINTNETAIGTTSRVYYVSDNEDIEKVLTTVENEDNSFYRIEKLQRRTKNDAAWHDYKGVSIFSSTANAGVNTYLGALGFEKSMNAYAFYGHTPLTASLLSVKYVLSDILLEDSTFMDYYTKSNNVYLYENKYTLPLGFMVKSDFEKKLNINNSNPFEVQNSFVQETTGYANMFTQISINNANSYARFSVPESSHIYAYVYSSTENVIVDINDELGINLSSKTFNNVQHNYIIDLGEIEEGNSVSIYPQNSEDAINVYAASFDEEIFKSAFNVLNSNPFNISEYSDTKIKGNITADADGLMYTSIPFDKGFSVFVDGKKVKTNAFKDAFISVPITKGSHEIEFKYSPQGLLEGSIISIISLVLFILITGYNFLRKRHKDL